MATPVSTRYVAASGAAIRAGRAAASSLALTGNLIIGGDSITEAGLSSDPFPWGLGKTRKSLRVAANTALAGRTIQQLLDALTAEVISKAPDVYAVRIGTNSQTLPAATFEAQYQQLLDTLMANNIFGLIHAIPPGGAPAGPYCVARNNYLRTQCAANPTKLFFVDDCVDVADSNYGAVPAFFPDGVHPNPFGAYTIGSRMAAILAPILSATPFLNTDPADVYPANAGSNQYVQNPMFGGSAGTLSGGATGVAPTGWTVTGAAGITLASSVVVADAGDANQNPWLRLVLNAATGAGQISISQQIQNPTIPADNTVKRFDFASDIRLVNMNTANVGTLSVSMQSTYTGATIDTEYLRMTASGILNETLTLRTSKTRDTTQSIAAGSVRLTISLNTTAAFTTPNGYLDIRCPTVRGLTT